MAQKQQKTYYRTGRRKVGLSQVDIARLLGVGSAHISLMESNRRDPSLRQLLALHLICQKSCGSLVGTILMDVQQEVLTRAKKQEMAIQGSAARGSRGRVQALRKIINLLS